MYLEYDAIVPTSRNPGANHAKLRDFRVVLFGLYFSSSIRVYPFYVTLRYTGHEKLQFMRGSLEWPYLKGGGV